MGVGELTAIGCQQHYAFGQWLRQRYGSNGSGLLPEIYSENDIVLQSTDVDRTLASAYCNLAGWYPPIGDEIWNEALLWQPIPVHTVPASSDIILGSTQPNCPAYNQAYGKLTASPEVTDLVNAHIDQLNQILTDAGDSTTSGVYVDLLEAMILRDTIMIETLWKKSYVPLRVFRQFYSS